MPLSSLFKRRKNEDLPYRRDPSVDLVGEYASDQLDPSLQLHWAGNPELEEGLSATAPNETHERRSAAVRLLDQNTNQQRQTTSRALQTIRERQRQQTA